LANTLQGKRRFCGRKIITRTQTDEESEEIIVNKASSSSCRPKLTLTTTTAKQKTSGGLIGREQKYRSREIALDDCLRAKAR
jgi:hypothetical protein